MNSQFPDAQYAIPAERAPSDARAAFITRTYGHLLGAVVAVAALCTVIIQSGLAERMFRIPNSHWIFLIGFIVVSLVAEKLAFNLKSPALQYAGLGLYVVFEAFFLSPILLFASQFAPQIIPQAVIATLGLFAVLTYFGFTSRKDFSFLRGIVGGGFLLLIAVAIGGWIFGFTLGLWFSVAAVGLTAGMILYQTQDVLRRYPTNMHVGAALSLFASIAMLFFYILRILIALQSRD